MTIQEKQQLKIARDTLKLSCIGTRILGGMDHATAQAVICELTGKRIELDDDCTCKA